MGSARVHEPSAASARAFRSPRAHLQITPADQEAFYRSALLGLRVLDAAGARRPFFGPEADAMWSAMQGALRPGDRLDLLIRNAAVANPGAFAARSVFGLPGLADDEPFGPDWVAPVGLGDRLLREAALPLPAATVSAVLQLAADAWKLEPGAVRAPQSLAPGTRILAAGAGAVLALAGTFQGRSGFDLGNQVVLITGRPGERQLFCLAVALLGSPGHPRVLSQTATVAIAREKPISLDKVQVVLTSSDADPVATATAQAMGRELGA